MHLYFQCTCVPELILAMMKVALFDFFADNQYVFSTNFIVIQMKGF